MNGKVALAVSISLAWSAMPSAADGRAGAAIYGARCAQCHDHAASGNRIPSRSALHALASEAIVVVLTSGEMKEQGAALSAKEKAEVAAWLGAPPASAKAKPNSLAPARPMHPPPTNSGDWTSWGNRAENWRFQPNPGISPAQVSHLKLKWAYGIAGVSLMRSQPVVYHGRVYVGGENGLLLSFDAARGCTYWSATGPPVRSGLAIGHAGEQDALFFGDPLGAVHAIALANGKELWQTKVSDHREGLVTGTPAYSAGRLFVP